MFPISRQGTFGESAHQETRTYHDKYVIHYDFSSVGLSPPRIYPPYTPPSTY